MTPCSRSSSASVRDGLHEGARQQFVHQVFLEPLAGAAAGLAAFLLFDLGQLLGQQVVDHRAGQQLVLAADGQPERVANAVRQPVVAAPERRDETARGQVQRADGLERQLGEQVVELGEIEGGGEAEQGQVAKEHQVHPGEVRSEEDTEVAAVSRAGTGCEPGPCAGTTLAAPGQEIEQLRIGQLRRFHPAQRARDLVDAAGRFRFPRRHHLLHLLALQVVLRSAQVAGDDRERHRPCMFGDVGLR